MLTVEDCRRKAAQWLDKAQNASDPKTSASMRRAAETWTSLAQQMEEANLRGLRSTNPIERPADLGRRRNISHHDTVHVGDFLRDRLHLSDESPDESA
jgi:phosphohistidine phosphatase SixA